MENDQRGFFGERVSARLAGLRLRERWGGWSREPFDRASRSHVSVYGR